MLYSIKYYIIAYGPLIRETKKQIKEDGPEHYESFIQKRHGHRTLLQFTRKLCNSNTVEPVYSGHPRDFRNWPLNTGSLKILTGRGLPSILMAYHTKTLHAKKLQAINWS